MFMHKVGDIITVREQNKLINHTVVKANTRTITLDDGQKLRHNEVMTLAEGDRCRRRNIVANQTAAISRALSNIVKSLPSFSYRPSWDTNMQPELPMQIDEAIEIFQSYKEFIAKHPDQLSYVRNGEVKCKD